MSEKVKRMEEIVSMNATVEMMLGHRTIRRFRAEGLSADIRGQLLNIAERTASSKGMQACSLIQVTDQATRRSISEICKQDYVNDCPEFWVFIVDQYRNQHICLEKGAAAAAVGAATMDAFFQGYTDAVLMAQSVTTAAESMGLGAIYFGSILNDAAEVIRLLDLPELTMPVLGLGLGLPDQEPQLKPRMDMKYRFFENTYAKQASYLEILQEYDEVMQSYYDLREANRRSDCFTDQVVSMMEVDVPRRRRLLQVVRQQGFSLLTED